MIRALATIALLALAAPALAEEPSADPVEPSSSRLVAAAWCPVVDSNEEPGADAPGCDLGLGAALARRGRLAAVAVIGAETVGLGVAWVAHSGGAVTVAVAAGLVAPYDGRGVRAEIQPALGATFGLGGGR